MPVEARISGLAYERIPALGPQGLCGVQDEGSRIQMALCRLEFADYDVVSSFSTGLRVYGFGCWVYGLGLVSVSCGIVEIVRNIATVAAIAAWGDLFRQVR